MVRARYVVAGLAAAAALVFLAAKSTASAATPQLPFVYLPADVVGSLVPPGTASLGMLAHHGTGVGLCPNLVEYIRALCRNYDRFLLVTDQARIDNAGALPANCTVVRAPNQGLDFGKHMYVLHNLRAPNLRRLGLFNDTVFVVRDLQPFFDVARERGWEVWGMSSSAEYAEHIQSYFVAADSPRAAQHLLRFFTRRTMDHVTDAAYSKTDLVKEFEIGMSRHLARQFTLHAWYSMLDVMPWVEPRDGPPNVSLAYWDVMLLMGCPVLKKFRMRAVDGSDILPLLDERYAATISGIDAKTIF